MASCKPKQVMSYLGYDSGRVEIGAKLAYRRV